jgi:uncharacterized protein
MKRALVIFAKAPQEGRVKTRLVPPLTVAQATALYRCFLRDTIASARQLGGVDLIISYTPAGTERLFARVAPGIPLLLQEGADFGSRLYNCFEKLDGAGYQAVCVMDTDSPTLPHAFIADGFAKLGATGDGAVVGPAADGGYYLIGLRRPHRELFTGISWSTSRVTTETLRRAREIGLAVSLLPQWYDVDTAADLVRLQDELARANSPGGAAPRTRAFLARVGREAAGPLYEAGQRAASDTV